MLDGESQKYAVETGAYIRQHFFGTDPRLLALVEGLTDDQIKALRRGGHDHRKLYAAYRAAVEHTGRPTVVLAQTVKGWTLGPGVEARNITHQAKKLNEQELRVFRDRLELPIPDEKLKDAPYYRPAPDSPELRYLAERRAALGGPSPRRVVISKPLDLPAPEVFGSFDAGSGTQEASTTMAFARLMRDLIRDKGIGKRIVPIIPDEARTFGMDPLFKEVGIYTALGQRYDPVDSNLVLSYREATDGQVLEEGITEAGSAASFQAAGTSYATHGEPMIPFYIFYSMFGFQRTADQFWAFADARGRGFLLGGTAGRTTLNGEGLQHEDGHTLVLASVVPTARVYDPAFAYESAAIIRDGIRRMHGPEPEDLLYYIALYNENYVMPARPDGLTDEDIIGACIASGRRRSCPGERRAPPSCRVDRSCSRHWRRRPSSPSDTVSRRRSGAPRRTSCCVTRRSRSTAGTCSTPVRRRARRWSPSSWARRPGGVRSWRSATGSARGRTWCRAGSRAARGAAWAPTASDAAIHAPPCGGSLAWMRRTSWRRRSRSWRAADRCPPRSPRKASRPWGSIRRRRSR